MKNDIVDSILNVERNIRHYKECKQHCKTCSKKCYQDCKYYIPKMISLEVMEKKQAELWKEYNRIHKGELRGDGTII